jgi:hypothetical protein
MSIDVVTRRKVGDHRPGRLFRHEIGVFITCPSNVSIEVRAGSEDKNSFVNRASKFEMSLT